MCPVSVCPVYHLLSSNYVGESFAIYHLLTVYLPGIGADAVITDCPLPPHLPPPHPQSIPD